MLFLIKRLGMFLAAALIVCTSAEIVSGLQLPGNVAMPQNFVSSASANSLNIKWPLANINLSQLENILQQNPGVSQFNILFPNQSSWGVTPENIQNLTNTFQQESQAVGGGNTLSNMVFTSIPHAELAGKTMQMLINPQGDIAGQMSDVLRQARYNDLNFSDVLPDWLKRMLLAIYDMVYTSFQFLGTKLAGLIGR